MVKDGDFLDSSEKKNRYFLNHIWFSRIHFHGMSLLYTDRKEFLQYLKDGKIRGTEEFMERCTYIACSFEISFIPPAFCAMPSFVSHLLPMLVPVAPITLLSSYLLVSLLSIFKCNAHI